MEFYFSIAAWIVTLIIVFIFFNKKKIETSETTIYGRLLMTVFVMLFLEIMTGAWILSGNSIDNNIYILACKLVMITYLVLNTFSSQYLIEACKVDKNFFIK